MVLIHMQYALGGAKAHLVCSESSAIRGVGFEPVAGATHDGAEW